MYDYRAPPSSVNVSGVFKNYNTIEEFKAVDKTALFNQVADEVSSSSNRHPAQLSERSRRYGRASPSIDRLQNYRASSSSHLPISRSTSITIGLRFPLL